MKCAVVALVAIICGVTLTAAPDPGLAEIRLTVTNIRHAEGQIYGGLFRQGDGFPKSDGRWRFTRTTVEGKTSRVLVFSNVPPGTYAVGFFHDLNGNRLHDRGFMTIPKEPFGFYRHHKPRLREPDFKDCAFLLPPGILEGAAPMQEWGR
jgi:uncharacterized protein (DUF2141 family)